MSRTKIGIFWPGDYRSKPNELAQPNAEEATVQLERALKKLGRTSYRIEGFLTRPHEAIEKLGPVDDPLIGVFVHWCYGPHTTDGVVGKDSPLLLASNFSGQWPGLVGLLNTGACLESLGRKFSRVWSDAEDWTADDAFMARLGEWCATGRIGYSTEQIGYSRSHIQRGTRSLEARRRGDQEKKDSGPDARGYVHGDDQRLLWPAAAGSHRILGTQSRPGLDHRPGPFHLR